MKLIIAILLPLSSLCQQLFTTAGVQYHMGKMLPAINVQVGWETYKQTTVSIANYNYGKKAPFIFSGMIGYQWRGACDDLPKMRVEVGPGFYVKSEKQDISIMPVGQISWQLGRWLEVQAAWVSGVQVGVSWVGRL